MKKYVLMIFLTILACISFVMIIQFYVSLDHHLSEINQRKIIFFLIIHGYFIIMVWRLLAYDTFSGYVDWLTWLTGIIFAIVCVTQTIQSIQRKKFSLSNVYYQRKILPSQQVTLTFWLKIYFQVSIYSTICFLILILYHVIRQIIQCYNKRQKEREIDQKIQEIQYRKQETIDQPCCSICLVEYEEKQKVLICLCKHIFHKQCLRNWVYNKNTCPLCRQQII